CDYLGLLQSICPRHASLRTQDTATPLACRDTQAPFIRLRNTIPWRPTATRCTRTGCVARSSVVHRERSPCCRHAARTMTTGSRPVDLVTAIQIAKVRTAQIS
ncbi:hypothetical protein EV175_006901, partial [Coemansia sp. RSA 1933]